MRGFRIFTAAFFSFFLVSLLCSIDAHHDHEKKASWVVKRDQRTVLAKTEYGEISAVNVTDGVRGGPYLLQFLTLEPNSLFLPVLLHADAVLYVHTGTGTLSWTDEDRVRNVDIRRGDVYTLPAGSLFYVQSKLEPERQKLRIHVIFSNTDDGIYNPSVGAYSGIRDLIVGFDRRVLQAAFQVSEEVLDELTNATRPPPIVHAVSKKKTVETLLWELEARFLKSFMGGSPMINKKKKPKKKALNIFDRDPDFENCNGWSTTVSREDLSSLGESNISVFMVNLTKGSMMGPHWNPSATEMAVVLHGQGMIRVVCSANSSDSHCRNRRFRVEEGDAFVVPRFHPMAQMSFNNDSFVFMGFSTSTRRNYPQFLAGKRSVLQVLDRYVLAMSFNVTNTTIDRLLVAQTDSIILDCTSCAEEEERTMEEEIKREKEREEERRREEEEAKRHEEEEARRREEEEAKREEEERRQREEEEARGREEEERRRQEEEEARRIEEEEAKKRQEEEAKREEEEAKREEEERRRREEEEEAKRREEEEAKREEKERRRREEEEEARRREEEEAKREEEERRWREEEEEARRREEAKREEEERREREEKEAKRRQEEEAKREEEERVRREEKEAKKRQEEEAMREEAEAKREEEERQRRQEESRRREEEGEAKRRREEEARKHEEEEERQRKEPQEEGKGREESPRTKEEEVAGKEYEERQRREEEEQAKRERRRRKEEEEVGEGDEKVGEGDESGGGYDGRKVVSKS